MIYLDIDAQYSQQINQDQLTQAAEETLKHEGKSPQTDLSLVLTDDDRIQQLNSQFLGINQPTDVLSFPAGDVDPDTGRAYLGDVIVSYPRAVVQSGARGHSVQEELQLLVVHGVLHLLGHDHSEPEEMARMWRAQSKILSSMDVSIDMPTFK